MNKNIKTVLMAASLPLAMMVAAPAQAAPDFIIDDFNVDTSVSVEDTTIGDGGEIGSGSPSSEGKVMNQTGGAAGWDRNLYAELTDGDRVQTIDCNNCDAGHVVADAGINLSDGYHYFEWLGASTDLSAYAVAVFDWSSDLSAAGTTAWLGFTDNSGETALTDVIALNADTTLTTYSIALSAFTGTGLGYAGIENIKLWFDGTTSSGGYDGNIDNAGLTVPEPGTMALLGLGLIGFAFRNRKPVSSVAA